MMSKCLMQSEEDLLLSAANLMCHRYVSTFIIIMAIMSIYLVQRGEDLVLREANYCVIDEVDSILIDEARTPLIISGSAEKPSDK